MPVSNWRFQVDASVALFPAYKDAYLERSKIHLDEGSPNDALYSLKQILKLDRKFVSLDRWLVLASRREQLAHKQPRTGRAAPLDFV